MAVAIARKGEGTGLGSGSAPPPPDERGRGGGGWVELVRARDDIDAHLLAGRLATAGIETRQVKDRTAPGAWLYGGSNPWAPVALLVRRGQYEDARIALAELSIQAPPFPDAAGGSRTTILPGMWWSTAVVLGVVVTIIVLADLARSVGR